MNKFSKSELELKNVYIKLTIFYDDLVNSKLLLSDNSNNLLYYIHYFRSLKDIVLILSNIADSINLIEKVLYQNDNTCVTDKEIRRKLSFVKHIRNKISGHLDDSLIEKALLWEPQIFSEINKDNYQFTVFLIYKSIFETALNSYSENNTKPPFFQEEIDLVVTDDFNKVSQFFTSLIKEIRIYIYTRLEFIKSKLKFYNKNDLIKTQYISSKVDFSLKSENEIDVDYNEMVNSFISAKESFLTKIGDLNKREQYRSILESILKDMEKSG